MLQQDSIDLNSTLKYRNQINNISIGRSFVFTIAGSPIKFDIYKASHNYEILKHTLHSGDTVTVYYVNSTTANLQVCQVEKSGQIVVSKELLESQNRVGGLVGSIGGFILLGITIWQFRKGDHKISQ